MSKITFRATIRDTPSSLRFGSEVPAVMFDICPADESEAVQLIALKKTALIITVGIDDGNSEKDDNATGARKSTKIHI